MKAVALLVLSLSLSPLGFAVACSNGNGGAPDAAPDALVEGGESDAADAGQACTRVGAVCASGPGFSCAVQFPTSDCYGRVCCILAPDGEPPYYDDAGTCPGTCASPDDIGCPTWYRSNACSNGTLCCDLKASIDAGTEAGDAGTD